jgi:hypothetical protein
MFLLLSVAFTNTIATKLRIQNYSTKLTRQTLRWIKSLVKNSIKSNQVRNGSDGLKKAFMDLEGLIYHYNVDFLYKFSGQLENFKKKRMLGCVLEV